jgi:hypothetical protein
VQRYLVNGRFTFRTVPPGTWTLTARVWFDDRWHESERKVAAGEDVEVVLAR